MDFHKRLLYRKLEGQALVVVVILLIVISIAVLSIYVRTTKEVERVGLEKKSNNAEQVSTSLLTAFSSIEETNIETICAPEFASGQKCCKKDSEINGFGIDQSLFTCSNAITTKKEICIERSSLSTGIQIPQDTTLEFYINRSSTDNCSLNLGYNYPNNSNGNIYIKPVFVQYSPTNQISAIYNDDISAFSKGYKFGSLITNETSWSEIALNTVHTVSNAGVLGNTVPSGYSIRSIRVSAYGKSMTVNATYTDPLCATGNSQYYKITARTYCDDIYRAYSINKLGTSGVYGVFDSAIFNGSGELTPTM